MKLTPRVIAMDLDDTLLKHDLSISDRTVDTLNRCADLGIIIMLASGRAPEAMYQYAERLGLHTRSSYLICHNGSHAIESDTRKTILEHRLPTDIALEAFRLTLDAGLSCHIYEGDRIIVSRETAYSDRDKELSGLIPIIPDDYEQVIRNGVYKLVIPGDPEFIVPVEAEFKVLFKDRATVFVSKPFFMEILPIQSGKGEALRDISTGILGLPQAQVMAFGDSMNDESMIAWAGMSVAMSNSRREILHLARYRTDLSNDEDGIADFLEKHVL